MTTVVPLNGSLDWEPFNIPGGTAPVRLVRLDADRAARAFTVLVRFPAGWERPETGVYEAAEDVVVLDGSIRIGDATYRAGEWAFIPARAPRRGSASPDGMLALARFAGPARWIPGDAPETKEAVLSRRLEDVDLLADTPLGKAALLRPGSPSSWLLGGPLEAGARSPVDCELLDLEERAWARVPAGARLPAFAGPVFCRTFEPDA